MGWGGLAFEYSMPLISSTILDGVGPTWWAGSVPRRLAAFGTGCRERLHLEGKGRFWRWVTFLTAPVVLFMHATAPAVAPGVHACLCAG